LLLVNCHTVVTIPTCHLSCTAGWSVQLCEAQQLEIQCVDNSPSFSLIRKVIGKLGNFGGGQRQ